MDIFEHERPTLEQVKDWYSRAMRDEINIFDHQNMIIAILARTLISEWEEKKEV
mgnify:CR=1 FL=1|tara:strand:+ start:254 stop:415 length:162 start_codon:yes stop_codon:yes gene_type:complete